MVKCNIKNGKYCNEPFCQYIFHQAEEMKWLQIWKNKLDTELTEYRRKEFIEKKLVKKK